MSSITTSKIDTKDGVTDITITTGNTIGPKIVVSAADGVWVGNSSANVFIANTQKAVVSVPLEISNRILFNGTLGTTTGSVTTNGSLIVSGSVSGVSTLTANTLVGANASITSNTFNLGTSSIAGSGYTRLPNGLLFQWGSLSASSTTAAANFPTSFSTVYSVSATASNNVSSTYQPAVVTITPTNFTVRTSNTTAALVYWMAIGV